MGDTAWAQQQLHLEKQKIENTPRKHVIEELLQEVQVYVGKGYNVIVLGDFNESIQSPEKLNEKMLNAGMYNLMEHKLGTKSLPRTFNRGSSAIDHIYMTKHLVDNVTYAGYAPFSEGYISDHRGLFFDIKENALFPTTQSNIMHHEFRKLKSKLPKRVEKYIEKLDEDWETHKITEKFKELAANMKLEGKTKRMSKKLNDLDNLITELMICAERRCANVTTHHPEYWSPKLAEAMKLRRFWKREKRKLSKVKIGTSILDAMKDFKYACDMYKIANNEYLVAKKNSRSLRVEFLKEVAEAYAKKNDNDAEKELKKTHTYRKAT